MIKINRKIVSILIVLIFLSLTITADSDELLKQKKGAVEWINANKAMLADLSDKIWEYAELPMLEYKSSRLLADALENQGFRVERGVAGMPTAFVASYGDGKPEIGFLAEYDALPRLSQKPVPYQVPLIEGGSGHGCGHNLLGVGGTAAAMAVKNVMEKHKLKGTVKLFGCPNEENDIGKVFMARDGLFNSLSAALDWHPASVTGVNLSGSHAIHNFLVTFTGKTAHAGGDPWDGKSALDGVEIMNIAVNYLREHVLPTVRIQYSIIDGGTVPNIVPARATAWYNCRDVTLEGSERVLDRIKVIAKAAAIATDTQVEVKMLTAIHEMLILPESTSILHKNLDWVGPPEFTAEDVEFARKVQRELGIPERGLHDSVIPFQIPEMGFGGGGTDVAEVSWNAPVLQMVAATNPLGSPGHSWAVVCAGKTAIGHKGLLTAAKAMAATGIELMTQPKTLASVRAEWKKLTKDRPYKSPIPPDVKPPVEPEPKKKN